MQADPEMRTALHYAVAYKHQSIFAELLASGADLMAEVGSLSPLTITGNTFFGFLFTAPF